MAKSRAELFVSAGVVRKMALEAPIHPTLDGVIEQAYVDHEAAKGPGWAPTSFHSKQFPGGVDAKHCGRQALYKLMNFPTDGAFPPRAIAIMEAGQAVEEQIIFRLGRTGTTIGGSEPVKRGQRSRQLKLEDPAVWLRGAMDAVLDGREIGVPYVVPVDIKTKDDRNLMGLVSGDKKVDASYVGQVMSYIHMCRLHHFEMGWQEMGLEPSEGGLIYYASRANPRTVYEEWVDWDPAYVDAGLARLAEWIQLFMNDELPPRDKSWRWTEEPCKWCDFKKVCRADIKNDVVQLSKSTAVEQAKAVRRGYDPKATQQKVIRTWEAK